MSKSHGLKGELFLSSFHSQPSWPKHLSSLKIGQQDFQLEKHSPHKKGFIVKLKGCDSKAQADELKFQEVFVSKNSFQSEEVKSFYLMELLGFAVKIEGEQRRASLLSFETDSKNQDFLVIKLRGDKSGNKKYSIPFVKNYIKKIDFQKKEVHLKLPTDFLNIF